MKYEIEQPKHDPVPRVLYKYATPSTVLAVLKNQKIRWANPSTYNDAFDTRDQYDFGFELDDLIEPAVDSLIRIAMSRDQNDPIGRMFIDDEFDEISIRYWRGMFRRSSKEQIKALKEHAATIDKEWYQARKKNLRVLCLSEDEHSEHMWSIYAAHHQGAVLGFKTGAKHFPLGALKKVRYKSEFVNGLNASGWIDAMNGLRPLPHPNEALEYLYFTKHTRWASEREWRMVSYGGDIETDFTDAPIELDEIASISFGLRSGSDFRHQVLSCFSNISPGPIFSIAKAIPYSANTELRPVDAKSK